MKGRSRRLVILALGLLGGALGLGSLGLGVLPSDLLNAADGRPVGE
jgi:hypothetical protein